MAPSRGFTRLRLPTSPSQYICHRCLTRAFATTSSAPSGHNRWSKIKHDKGKNDALKNRQRSSFSQEIATASRLFGPEPSLNTRLADLITKAKKEGFAKASIEGAIARGQGKSASGAALESVTVEGMLPNNVGVIVECETESRLRTLAAVRLAMKEAGGNASPCAFLFEKRGRVVFEGKEGVGMEEVFEPALEAGATDVEETFEGGVVIFCDTAHTKAVGESVSQALGLNIKTSEIMWWPNEETMMGLQGDSAADELLTFLDSLEEKDTTVQGVAMNVAQGNLDDDAWKTLQSRLST